MTESEWQACEDPAAMQSLLQGKPQERRWRLLACACLRRVWPLLADERSRRAVEAAEVFADGEMGVEQFRRTAGKDAWEAFCETDPRDDDDEDDPRYDPHPATRSGSPPTRSAGRPAPVMRGRPGSARRGDSRRACWTRRTR